MTTTENLLMKQSELGLVIDLVKTRLVLPVTKHIFKQGGGFMQKEYTFGNSKVIVFSPLAQMSKEEQKEYFQNEWQKGNSVLREIAQAAHDCLINQAVSEK
jgi:hypothetical protein